MKSTFLLLICLFPLGTLAQDTSRPVTIFVAGDSTAALYGPRQAPMTGWAQSLAEFTTPEATVDDRATCGRSTKSFRTEYRWKAILNDLQSGDFVLIQFGHNDQKKDRPAIYAEAQTEFQANLIRFVEEVRAKGATPILVTSVSRRLFDPDGTLRHSLGDYPEATRQAARETDTPLVDLYALTRAWLEAAGPEESRHFFMNLEPDVEPNYPKGNADNSHFHRDGARCVAQMFISDVQRQGLEIAKFFKH